MPAIHTDLLKARRDELDLSNPQLARLVKITPAYLVNVLCGSDQPSMRLVHRFARVLSLAWQQIVVDIKAVPEDETTESADDEDGPLTTAVAS